jgi:hypothetical protein
MPWTRRDYPDSMKGLSARERGKAIDIANALLEEGYPEGRAIAVAQAQAKRWARGAGQPRPRRRLKPGQKDAAHEGPRRHVKPHRRGWQVVRDGARRPSRVLPRKQEAVDLAVHYGRRDKGRLVIHREDGKVDEEWDL